MNRDHFPSREPSSGESNAIVLGVFSSALNVDAALNGLRAANFSGHQLGVMARADVDEWTVANSTENSGLANMWDLGIAAGLLPAIGPIIAGGMLGSVLASAVAGAAAGGLPGGLIGLGLDASEVQFFEDELAAGQMIVTVLAGRRATDAVAILSRHGARDLESTRKLPPPE